MCSSRLFALGPVLDIKVKAAARFVILKIHNFEIVSPGPEVNLPLGVARTGKVTTHNPVPGMEPGQFGDDLIVEELHDVSLVLIAEAGMGILGPVVMEHKCYCPAREMGENSSSSNDTRFAVDGDLTWSDPGYPGSCRNFRMRTTGS
jgi:hypothetical protein